MRIALKQIEANVVISGINREAGTVHTQCLWECESDADTLIQIAAECAHRWAEQDGMGEVSVQIFDYRT